MGNYPCGRSVSFSFFEPPMDLSEILDFFELVEVVDRAETFDTRDADDFLDDNEIRSGAICFFALEIFK